MDRIVQITCKVDGVDTRLTVREDGYVEYARPADEVQHFVSWPTVQSGVFGALLSLRSSPGLPAAVQEAQTAARREFGDDWERRLLRCLPRYPEE